MSDRTCILVFARSPRVEGSKKALTPSVGSNRHIWNRLYRSTVSSAQKSGFPVILYDESMQKGVGFGEKITSAIQEAMLEYERVVVIGSDCPALDERVIWRAAQPRQRQVAIGPDSHGGCYLFVLDNEAFDPNRFSRLPWNTSELCTALHDYFVLKGYAVIFEKEQTDVNALCDLWACIARLPHFKALKVISTLLEESRVSISLKFSPSMALRFSPIHRRGPPCSDYPQ